MIVVKDATRIPSSRYVATCTHTLVCIVTRNVCTLLS